MKNKYALLILFFAMLYCYSQAYSNQNIRDTINSDYTKSNHRLGFTSSMMSAYGLSYEYFLNRDFVLEFNSFVFSEGGDEEYHYAPYFVSAIGAELQYNFHQDNNTRLYMLAAASFWHSNYKKRYNWDNSKYDEFEDIENYYISGLAIGLEYNISKTILTNLEGGCLYWKKQYFDNQVEWNSSEQKYLAKAHTRNSYIYGLGLGIGVYYSF